jgi:peptidoglycan/xylan/chitin deacetylase (PgdA/CDA1 family)
MKPALPVLMYHSIVPDVTPSLHRTVVSEKQFLAQMKWLYTEGYQTIAPLEARDLCQQQTAFEKKIVLTFDDGYRSYIDFVQPVLAQFGFRATLFLSTHFVGAKKYPDEWILTDKTPAADRPLTADEIITLHKSGWHIEAHTQNHIRLFNKTPSKIAVQMDMCNAFIETITGQRPTAFAFPYGSYDALSLALAQHRYALAFTTHPDLWQEKDDVHRIPRLEMTHTDSMLDFIKKIQYGYSSYYQLGRQSVSAFLRADMRIYDGLRRLF